jgi:hypothetical protein
MGMEQARRRGKKVGAAGAKEDGGKWREGG